MDYINVLFILYIMAAILVIIEQLFGRDKTYKYNYFFAIVMMLVAAFRPAEDTYDTHMYEERFFDVPSLWDWINNGGDKIADIPLEYGYIFLNSVVKTVIDEPVIVFLLIASISVSIYYFVFKELSPYPMLSIFCYMTFLYVFKETSQIRNGAACAIALYSIKYVINKDLRKFILTILIASSFHLTAFIALIFYPVSLIKWTKKKYVLFLVLSICLFNLNWIYGVMDDLLSNGTLFYRIAKYHGDKVATQDVNIYKYGIYIFMELLFLSKVSKESKLYNTLLAIFSVGIFIQSGFHEFRELADRVSSICYTVMFLLIPLYIKMERYKWLALLILLIIMPLYYVRTLQWLQDPF